jgi:hypothetical protein
MVPVAQNPTYAEIAMMSSDRLVDAFINAAFPALEPCRISKAYGGSGCSASLGFARPSTPAVTDGASHRLPDGSP